VLEDNGAGPAASLPPPPPLRWTACEDGFECSVLKVPLDYARPEQRQLDVALVRLPATGGKARIGSLLANPGGPGASGIDFVRYWAKSLSPDLRGRFDIVGFDPRGVGQSSPLECHDNLQGLIALNPNPRTEAEWLQVEAAIDDFAALCAERAGEKLGHLGTLNAVRDMDRMRQALGDKQLTYFGYSYGTVLGQVYAGLFPGKVRALVLDGAVDISLGLDQLGLEQARGFEGALEHWARDCDARRCLSGGFERSRNAVDEVLRRSYQAPILSSGERAAGPGDVVYAVAAALYSPQTWNDLARAMQAALGGDGARLIELVDFYLGRREDGSYENLTEMYNAVTCLDYAVERDPLHYRSLAPDFEARASFFGRSFAAGGLYCASWRTEPAPLTAPKAEGAAPLLVIGTTGDPATPYKWSVSVSRQLGNATLLTFNGEGHTAYLTGNRCIDQAVNRYLIELKSPAVGATCGDAARSTPLKVSD
jgi:pimeloyl-ACP methyl ester carboxylesterase